MQHSTARVIDLGEYRRRRRTPVAAEAPVAAQPPVVWVPVMWVWVPWW